MKNNKFLKFILVGILNTIFGYSAFAFFIYLNIHYSLAVLLSTILGVLFNFKSIGKLVFDSSDNSLIYRFVLVYVVIYILNISGLWVLKQSGFENMYINGFILLAPLAIVSFVLNKKYVFKEVKNEKN
jgi:putative flippase GtrA